MTLKSERAFAVRILKNLMCPARDGVMLATDVYLPEGAGAVPVILMRTPYGKHTSIREKPYSHYTMLVEAGYGVAVQDCRGTGISQGRMNLNGINEHEDGYDAVEWLAKQDFCNGKIGMYGLSYFGFTQLAAAAQGPEHLRAICPFMTLGQEPFGASLQQTLNLGHLFWAYGQLMEHADTYIPDEEKRREIIPILQEHLKKLTDEAFHLPINKNPAAMLQDVPLLDDYLDLVNGICDKDFWKSLHLPLRQEKINCAMLHGTGWLDVACDATISNYQAARASAPASEHTKLLIGPWTHGGEMPSMVDDIDFGQENSGESLDVHGMMKRFFDRYLCDEDTDCFPERVRYFVRGENRWESAADWPPPEAKIIYLQLTQEGFLKRQAPQTETYITLLSDPMNPVPSAFTDSKGRKIMANWSEMASREDVLTYQTEAFTKKTTVAGEICLKARLIPDVPDLDLVCRVLDVDERGRAVQLCAGLRRARHRNGFLTDAFLRPGEEVMLEVKCGNLANTFLPGHCLAIQLCGSMYPAHNRNLHTVNSSEKDDSWQIAHSRLILGGAQATELLVPVL